MGTRNTNFGNTNNNNRYLFKDILIETEDKIINELASELEQTNNKLNNKSKEKNEKKVCEPIRISMNKKPFLVNKVKCGKYYTAGINNKGIPFLFGNKTTDNYNTNNEIIFFSFNNNMNYNLVAKDIYCGEYFIIIHLEHNQILIYSFNDGLSKKRRL